MVLIIDLGKDNQFKTLKAGGFPYSCFADCDFPYNN